MADHEVAVQDSEGEGRHGEEVHRGDGLAVVAQESQPMLAPLGTPGRTLKPTRDGRLGNRKTEF